MPPEPAKGRRANRKKTAREERPPTLNRTLYYLSATVPNRKPDTAHRTFEECVRLLLERAPNIGDRMHSPAGDVITRTFLSRYEQQLGSFSGIVVTSSDGQHRRKFDMLLDQPQVDLSAEDAGEGKAWESGSALFMTRGDEIVVNLTSGLRLPTLANYFSNVFRTYGILTGTESYLFQAPIATNVLEHLKDVRSVRVYQLQAAAREPVKQTDAVSVTEEESAGGAVVIEEGGPFNGLFQGIAQSIQGAVEVFASREALDPKSIRFDLNIKLDRRNLAHGGAALQHIARTLVEATAGDPTAVGLVVETGQNRVKHNIVTQRTTREILRHASMMPDLIDFHRVALDWMLALEGVGDDAAI